MRRHFYTLCILVFTLQYGYGQTRVKINPLVDDSFDAASKAKLDAAIISLDSVINSQEFERQVLEKKFKVGNFGLSSQNILEIIKSGMNYYKDAPKDYSIDLRLKVFDEYAGSGNFGFTDMNTFITRTHRCYILNTDVKCYISHLAHEYMHQVGFFDERNWIGKKTQSVPYKIGNIVDDIIGAGFCAAQHMNCPKQQ